VADEDHFPGEHGHEDHLHDEHVHEDLTRGHRRRRISTSAVSPFTRTTSMTSTVLGGPP
jgi:hypothetical protein